MPDVVPLHHVRLIQGQSINGSTLGALELFPGGHLNKGEHTASALT